ncbi:phage head closure protein [Microvirga terricola]|uniref:Phage head closure protein n=1 Tax=Microvirga terricola TaxID=2719797 RepID=A0ABX0VD63_9HYPH|nr:phage head closure protein [Microvirga terricola]NIX76895.1 phage head closure protein [Microvirga terricola]
MKIKSLSIGARARRFVLELPLERPGGFGGVIRSYAAGPQIWGAMEMLSGTERIRAGRPEQSLTHKITLRYREGVTGAMRLTSGLRRFAIRTASDPDGARRDLVCLVEEISAWRARCLRFAAPFSMWRKQTRS